MLVVINRYAETAFESSYIALYSGMWRKLPPESRKVFGVLGAGAVLFLALLPVFNAKITTWVNGAGFQAMLDQETSKGLKFEGHYAGLQRVGIFGLKADDFHGQNGSRTIVSIDADGITGSFNPLGMILRRWQVEDIHLKSGIVMLQKTEPIPGAPKNAPLPPWWALVWPYRVQLQDVRVDDARILFALKGQESASTIPSSKSRRTAMTSNTTRGEANCALPLPRR